MNDKKYVPLKLFKLKYIRRDSEVGEGVANIPDFLQNWCGNFKYLRKLGLKNTESFEI